MATECLFCRVIAGQSPASVVYRDDEMVAIRDLRPVAPLHLLLIPTKHVPTLNDLGEDDDALLGRMFRRAALLAREHGVDQRGYRTVFNCNRESGQSVYHIHLHLLGGRAMGWPPG